MGAAHHDLVDEVDDSRCRLLRLQLGEYVALVVGLVGRLARDESEASAEKLKRIKLECNYVGFILNLSYIFVRIL